MSLSNRDRVGRALDLPQRWLETICNPGDGSHLWHTLAL